MNTQGGACGGSSDVGGGTGWSVGAVGRPFDPVGPAGIGSFTGGTGVVDMLPTVLAGDVTGVLDAAAAEVVAAALLDATADDDAALTTAAAGC